MCGEEKECRTVEPIRDLDKLEMMKRYLYHKSRRDYTIFVIGINSGLRVGDILRLTVEDVAGGIVTVREEKTGKLKRFALSETCAAAIKDYLEHSKITEGILFPGRKAGQPVGRIQIWRSINDAARFARVQDNVGTHTMRKSFGYWAYKNGADILEIMKCLNHFDPEVTMRYIGLTEEHLNQKVYLRMNL